MTNQNMEHKIPSDDRWLEVTFASGSYLGAHAVVSAGGGPISVLLAIFLPSVAALIVRFGS